MSCQCRKRGLKPTIAILGAGGVDDDAHRQTEGIDQSVDLAAFHLLAGIITHGVVFVVPFSADFSDWLSEPERRRSEPFAQRRVKS